VSLPRDPESVTRVRTIYGPAEPLTHGLEQRTGIYPAPPKDVRCPDCGRRGRVVAGLVVGGIQCGVMYRLECLSGHEFQFFSGDDFTEVAYAGDL
jgi:hypothetical protein